MVEINMAVVEIHVHCRLCNSRFSELCTKKKQGKIWLKQRITDWDQIIRFSERMHKGPYFI